MSTPPLVTTTWSDVRANITTEVGMPIGLLLVLTYATDIIVPITTAWSNVY